MGEVEATIPSIRLGKARVTFLVVASLEDHVAYGSISVLPSTRGDLIITLSL